jgi:hypothetical protein
VQLTIMQHPREKKPNNQLIDLQGEEDNRLLRGYGGWARKVGEAPAFPT